ncbi:hypothetical protein EC973_000568 [Apophysomyces ossiformis]|uniref:Galactose oxidase n=1 Tax=Apophysomyces ossiformis TaxID=679940 RepID=A0A8H7BQ83_9FUNG|nr:hypothetical protein EC973_000568 [Apophysomyces ossiformis]
MLAIYLLLLVQIVYAIDIRKHHTATRLPNGTVYILGGIHTTDKFISTALTLRINSDLSISSTAHQTETIAGHSAYWHTSSHSVRTLFGLHQPNIFTNTPGLNVPSPRYHHTSIELDKAIYIIGGRSSLYSEYGDIWKFISDTWYLLSTLDHTLAGHSTIAYHHWLISCFGATHGGNTLLRQCTWFDTRTLSYTTIAAKPPPRIHACMTLLPGRSSARAILFGGQSHTTDLGDLWEVHLTEHPAQMTWHLIGESQPRSGHADVLLNSTVLMYYGGSIEDVVYLDLENRKWISPSSRPRLQIRQADAVSGGSIEGKEGKQGLKGGEIAGIVIAVIGFLVLSISYFVWNRRRQRQRNRPSPRSRFSLQPPALSRGNNEARLSLGSILMRQRSETEDSLIVRMPEPAKIQSRISQISFGSQFRICNVEEEEPKAIVSTADGPKAAVVPDMPPTILMDEYESDCNGQDVKERQHSLAVDPIKGRRESTTLKRLTLNIFAARQQQDEGTLPSSGTSASPSSLKLSKRNTIGSPILDSPATASPTNRRRSSLFRLLQLPMITATGPPKKLSRASQTGSIGGKSVASIQWVEFNDAMDYKEQHGNASMHLTVTNPRRSMTIASGRTSLCTEASSPASTPRSESFPRQYHLSESEALSWGDDLVDRINHHRQLSQNRRQSFGSDRTFTLHHQEGRSPPDSQT